jgi:hypothetical protein
VQYGGALAILRRHVARRHGNDGVPAETFIRRPSGRTEGHRPTAQAQLAPLLRAEEELSAGGQRHVRDVVGVTLRHIRAKNKGG